MREILFRGKRKCNGTWTSGYLFCIWERAYICWGTTNGVPNMEEVIPETVCQYTGLTDKNGRKIFEGDILQCENEYGSYTTSIYCEENTLCVDVPWLDNFDYTSIGFAESIWKKQNYEVEIIGNIYDNPELLEVKQDG